PPPPTSESRRSRMSKAAPQSRRRPSSASPSSESSIASPTSQSVGVEFSKLDAIENPHKTACFQQFTNLWFGGTMTGVLWRARPYTVSDLRRQPPERRREAGTIRVPPCDPPI